MAVVATLSKGYDLDYIWKQVDRGPAKDGASYYIHLFLEDTRRAQALLEAAATAHRDHSKPQAIVLGNLWSVCYRRTESGGEPFTYEKILATSRWVCGRLNTLAPISGSHGAWRAGSLPGVKIIEGCPDLELAGSLARGWTGALQMSDADQVRLLQCRVR